MRDEMPSTGSGNAVIFVLIIAVLFGCGIFGAITPKLGQAGADVAIANISQEQAETFEKRASDNQKDQAVAGFASNVAIATAGFQANTLIAWTFPATLALILGILLTVAYILHKLKRQTQPAEQAEYN